MVFGQAAGVLVQPKQLSAKRFAWANMQEVKPPIQLAASL
jgi:hypothetical protein